MKVCLLIYSLQATFILAQVDYYDSRYDNMFDVDFLVQNPRLLKKYVECFLDKGPCTPIGKVFKSVLPEVISTACAKCTPSQKRFARKTFEAFKMQLTQSYDELLRHLDPNNIYYEKFEKAVANI